MVIILNVGDLVGRKSYNCDVIFKITRINNDIADLSGVYVRLYADSDINDLILIDSNELEKRKEESLRSKRIIVEEYKEKMNHITGKILHLDSDIEYLNKCMELYKELNIYANGILIDESEINQKIIELIKKYRPNIVVITGHDSFNKKDIKELKNYKNSINFMKAIIKVREYYSLDDICIFAGACGSNFEALIASGANFASSIDRQNIEAYDPAIVAILSAITPFNQVIDIKSVNDYSILKNKSIGGIETYGKMRLLIR